MMCQGRSHSLSALPFADALVERGHDVTFYFEVQAPETLPLGNGVKQALLHLDSDQAQLVEEWKAFQDFIWNVRYDGITLLQPYQACANSFNDALISKANQYWATANQTWDLIFVDGLFASSGYAMALLNRHKTPYITFQTTELLDNHVYSLALSRWYSSTRPMLVPFDFSINNFFHRLQHCYESMKVFVTVHFFGEKIVQDAVSKAGVTDFSWDILMNSAAMTLSDYVDGWMFAQSVANDFIKIGAHCPAAVDQLTDSSLNAFVNDETSKGTILIAFGTFAQWNFASDALKRAFVEAFNNLPGIASLIGLKNKENGQISYT
uniref:glucuronosyltransferase n=1 Tax=Plectus sambesii TaxID=2011161 RepID=A0A914UNW3_9BILA